MAKIKTLTPVFMKIWNLLAKDQPEPEFEYRFIQKSTDPRAQRYKTETGRLRAWRFDVYWLANRVAVELEGGAQTTPVKCPKCGYMVKWRNKFTKKLQQVYAAMGGHLRGEGYRDNCMKYNAAAVLGWRVLRYTRKDLDERPVQIIEEITGLLSEGKLVDVPEQGELF
jgi:predicted RNA-binding Zn-ribbon protein involved in translation (DUF1610 family)